MLCRALTNQIILPFPINRFHTHSSEQPGSFKNLLIQLLAGRYVYKSHGQALICHECSSQDCMRSQIIRPHHKPHARLATLAMRSATGDVQDMSTGIQISSWLCTRLFDGTLQSGCTIWTETPFAISCSRWSDFPENSNIVWWSGLHTRLTSHMEQSSINHQSREDYTCVQKTVENTPLSAKSKCFF